MNSAGRIEGQAKLALRGLEPHASGDYLHTAVCAMVRRQAGKSMVSSAIS
jgi:hypothetical protein